MIIVLLFCDARTDYIKKLSTKAYITNYEVNQAKEDGVDYIALYACRNVSHHSAKSWYTLHNYITAAY